MWKPRVHNYLSPLCGTLVHGPTCIYNNLLRQMSSCICDINTGDALDKCRLRFEHLNQCFYIDETPKKGFQFKSDCKCGGQSMQIMSGDVQMPGSNEGPLTYAILCRIIYKKYHVLNVVQVQSVVSCHHKICHSLAELVINFSQYSLICIQLNLI